MPAARRSGVVGTATGRVGEESTLSQSQAAGDRLVAVGDFAAGLAHELNSPIGSILLAARNAKATPERADECLDTILRNARRCADVVRSVLAVSRSEPKPPQPLDLNAIARQAAEAVGAEVEERRASIELRLDPSIPAILANPLEIRQAIANLLSNAVESAESGVQIRLATLAGDDGVTVRVSDDGRGIPEGTVDRVFEPFFTTRQEEGGVGLGLSLVRAIAQAWGGSVTLAPSDGGGTRAELVLPAAAPRGDA